MPRVSVLTPTYNHAPYIVECVESVRAQTFDDWEMIVIDDGSTDGTADLVEAIADPRVKVIRQANRGLSDLKGTYNAGLAASSGDLIAILEGDDYWPADKLSRQVPDFVDPNVVLSSGWVELVDSKGASISVQPDDQVPDDALRNRPVGRAALSLLDTRHLTFTFPVSTLVRRSALEAIGGFQQPEQLPLVDLPTFLRLSVEGEFRFHKAICGHWRRHLDSTTLSRLPQILDGVYRLAYDFLAEHGAKMPASREEIDAMDDQWASFQAHRRVLLGRWLLAEGKRSEARRAFQGALRYRGNAKRRLKAQIGMIGCVGLPVEWLYLALGLRPWRTEIQLHSGDSTVNLALADAEALNLLKAWESSQNPK